jgi:hypothetical protein
MLEAPSFKLNYPTDWLLQIKRVKYPGPYPCPFPEQRRISCLNACGEGVLNGTKMSECPNISPST